MKSSSTFSLTVTFSLLIATAAWANTVSLEVAKDTFGRSNKRNQNSGGSQSLYMAHNEMLRTIIAFDLSAVTNRVVGAELILQQNNTNEKPLTLTVCPMVQTDSNARWVEGTGALGANGRNALEGEATFSRCAYPAVSWETAEGGQVTGWSDNRLWMSPVARQSRLSWKQGEEITLTLDAASLVEKLRTSDTPLITFGLWGTAGNGYYTIASKESGNGPVLILTTEE